MAAATKLDEFKALRRQVQDAMQQLAALAEARGLQVEDHTEDISSGGEKSAEQPLADVLRRKADALNAPFRLAVVGEFSRGKSTLVNALLNRDVLANDHRPNTAAQTVVKYGTPERFTVSFLPDLNRAPETHQTGNLLEDLAAFVSDAEVDNYEALLKGDTNSLAEQIDRVDVWCASDFLKRFEIEIVDTPGLGSVFLSHKEVTLKAVRTVDATLFAIQIDPGVGRGEIAFIRFISEHVPRIFFVITKADKVQPKDEIPDRVEHIRKTINIKASVDVNHIYPVSAKLAADGGYAESGFPVFVPALEQFLARSSGFARLVSPVRFSRVHARQMAALVKDALKKLDVSLAEVEAELKALREEEKRVRAQEKTLLAFVDERVDSIIKNTLHGIDTLPGLIQMSVEREIDSLKSDELRRADFFIQPAIKEAVVKWIEQRKAAFSGEIKTLNRHVKQEMNEIMKAFQFDEEQLSLIRSIDMEVNLPLDTSRYTRDIGDEIVKLLVSTGISSSIASIAGSIARAAAGVFNTVKSGLARLFGGRPQPPKDNTAEIKTRLKNALRETLPNNPVNTYHGIVYGHRQNSRRLPGVKDAIEGTFGDWGTNLKNDISSIISNNLKTRLKELERRAKEKRAGKKDYEADKRRLEKEKAELDQLLRTLNAFDEELAKAGEVSQ